MSINDKIKQVLLIKNLSPSYFADDIGVQRSSISHILSGRNRPSLDIIQKIVRRFPEFTYDWFLEEENPQLLFSEAPTPSSGQLRQHIPQHKTIITEVTNTPHAGHQPVVPYKLIVPKEETITNSDQLLPSAVNPPKQVDRILIFYTDGTFREYTPA